ncbi:MAG: coenzyme F420-0:L-glutamate ligase [Angustibacter sp.]
MPERRRVPEPDPERGVAAGPAPADATAAHTVTMWAVRGIGEVDDGTDLAMTLLQATWSSDLELHDGDVLVVSSKVVSKALGLVHQCRSTAARDAVVAASTRRLVARRRTPRGDAVIVRAAAGPVMAAAGVDGSNTRPGTVLSLPADPDAAARDLRGRLRAAGAPVVGVVISDTAGRPWRRGQTDLALGVAGVVPVDDLRGAVDAHGGQLEVTERALADELACAADLVKGKLDGVPAAVVRGLGRWVTDEDGPGAADLLRAPSADWFRLGHVEAVRAAIGIPPDAEEPPSASPEPVGTRMARAVRLARRSLPGSVQLSHPDLPASSSSHPGSPDSGGPGLPDAAVGEVGITGPDFWCGVAVQRLLAALWSEELTGELVRDDQAEDPITLVRVTDSDDVLDALHPQPPT